MKLTKRFMDWYHGNDDREKEPPRDGIGRVGYIVWNYAGSLVLVNVVFLLCCIPVVTIPAAFAALNRYVSKLFRVGYGADISDFMKEWKASFLRCLPVGAVCGGLMFYGYYLMSLAGNFAAGMRGALTGTGAAATAVSLLFCTWFFFLAALLELRFNHLLKNTMILLLIEWKADLLLLVSELLFWNAVLLLFPYSVFFLILCGFSVRQLIVCAILNPSVEKRILQPYENGKADC